MDAARSIKDKLTGGSSGNGGNGSSGDPPPEFDGTTKTRRLLVAAGPSYAAHSQIPVPVNAKEPVMIHSRSMLVLVHVRIRNYHGLPSTGSAETSKYFDAPSRKKDLYSIGFSFIPKRDIRAADLVWGNDFDHPVKKYLPPGFNYAFKIVKEFVDPGLSCDAYADNPWVLGPALSCWFMFRIGPTVAVPDEVTQNQDPKTAEWAGEEGHEEKKRNRVQLLEKTGTSYAGPVTSIDTVKRWLQLFPESLQDGEHALEEGADGDDAAHIRSSLELPESGPKRRSHFLKESNRDAFVFERGRLYSGDFFNPHIDFDAGKLKLPGFSLNVLRFVGDKTHTLRYVLKDRSTNELMFCVTLSMLFNQDVERAERAEADAIKRTSEVD